jgi:hypothetical protein
MDRRNRKRSLAIAHSCPRLLASAIGQHRRMFIQLFHVVQDEQIGRGTCKSFRLEAGL